MLGCWLSGPCLPGACKPWADHPAQEECSLGDSGLHAYEPLGTKHFHLWPQFSFRVVVPKALSYSEGVLAMNIPQQLCFVCLKLSLFCFD